MLKNMLKNTLKSMVKNMLRDGPKSMLKNMLEILNEYKM